MGGKVGDHIKGLPIHINEKLQKRVEFIAHLLEIKEVEI
jgi:hypothetical protein